MAPTRPPGARITPLKVDSDSDADDEREADAESGGPDGAVGSCWTVALHPLATSNNVQSVVEILCQHVIASSADVT